MSENPPSSQCAGGTVITAAYTSAEVELNAAQPSPAWQKATQVSFCNDWQGNNADPGRETKVRVLWNERTLYIRFECSYRELFTFTDSDPNGRRDQLWDRDVAEAFIQPDRLGSRYYKEFEVSPNGMWIDLDIAPDAKADLKSGLRRSVSLDEKAHTWAAELAIPMKAITSNFDPSVVWHANFYREEGQKEPRAYLAWQPTHSHQPNLHVPSAFGEMRIDRPPIAAGRSRE